MKTKLAPISLASVALCLLLAAQGISHADILYASSISTYSIYQVNPAGSATFFSNTGLNYPTGLVFDGAGYLYAASANANDIMKFNSSGVGAVFASPGEGFTAMAFNSGNIYAAQHSASFIEKFDSSGVGTLFVNTNLNDPMGMAFDSSGNLYVANRGNNTIDKFNSLGVGALFASTGLNHPAGLAFDSAGNLYAANQGGGTVEKFNTLGVGTLFGAGLGTPNEIAFDSAGNLYAADETAGAIMKFGTSGGSASVFSTGAGYPFGLAFQQVPEPATWSLLALGVVALLGGRRLRRTEKKLIPCRMTSALKPGLAAFLYFLFANARSEADYIYLANYGDNTIEKFDSSGNGSLFANWPKEQRCWKGAL